MADIAAPAEPNVTTGPIRGSRKVHVPAPGHPSVRVAMREIDLEPSSGEPPLRVYDTSGPYTDPTARIDIMAGPPPFRPAWILPRGAGADYPGRATKPANPRLHEPAPPAG